MTVNDNDVTIWMIAYLRSFLDRCRTRLSPKDPRFSNVLFQATKNTIRKNKRRSKTEECLIGHI